MATFRVMVPYRDAPSAGQPPAARYTTIQVEAESVPEAQRLAVVEFQEMAGLCQPGERPRVIEGEIRVERAPVTARASFDVAVTNLGPRVASARLVGTLNSYNYQHFQESLDNLKAKDIARLVLDLSGLTYVNSTGLSLFVAAGDVFDLRLAAVPAKITRLFRMIGLDKLLPTYISVAEAAKAASPGGA